MNKPKLLITGGSGFIGTNLILNLRHRFEICNIDVAKPKLNELAGLWASCNLLNEADLQSEIDKFKPRYVIHLAARTDLGGRKSSDYEVNFNGTRNLINALHSIEGVVEKVLFCSSKFVNQNGITNFSQDDCYPHTTYGESKLLMERYIIKSNLKYDWLILRPTSIWGEYFSTPYRQYFEHIRSGRYFHIGDTAAMKTYGYVGNTVFQIEKLLLANTLKLSNRIFYLGDYPAYDIREWSNEIGTCFGKRIHKLPVFLLRGLAVLGDLLQRLKVPFPMTSFRLANMTQDGVNDINATISLVGEGPFTRAQGVERTVKWINSDNGSNTDA